MLTYIILAIVILGVSFALAYTFIRLIFRFLWWVITLPFRIIVGFFKLLF